MHHFVACTSSISWDIILFSHIQYKTANITCFVWEVLPKSFESWPSHGNACAHLSQLESSPRLWTYNMGRTKEVRGPVQHVYRWHWHLVASSKAHWWCGSLPILSWRPVVTLNGISSLSCWDAPPPGAPSPSDRNGRLRSTDRFGGLAAQALTLLLGEDEFTKCKLNFTILQADLAIGILNHVHY